MVDKIMSTGPMIITLLVINDSLKNRSVGYTEIFYDPIFYIIIIFGIIVSLTIDEIDPTTVRLKSARFVFFSFSSSMLLSSLAVAAKIEYQLDWFVFYGMIAITTVTSPAIVRGLRDRLPALIVDSILDIIKDGFASFFKWGLKKFEKNDINNEENIEKND